MFRPYSQNQMFLLPPSMKDYIDESHPVHMINDLVEKLDLSILLRRYGQMGQPAYHPELMLKVIFYGFTIGIFSARKMARACQENLAFQYLAGGEKPAFKTFIEFRKRHRVDMQGVFLETAKLARALGLYRLGQVALDGSKIKANTSKHKAMSYGRMQDEEKRLKEEIEALLKQAEDTDTTEDQVFGKEEDGYSLKAELSRRESRLKKIGEAKASLEEREKREHPGERVDPKKQISFADQDARCFTKKSDGTNYVYNGQVAVDMGSQVIVENHIEESVQDAKAVEPALGNMEKGLGELPEKLVIDAGYANTDTMESCQEHEVIPVCSPSREDKEPGEVVPGRLDSFIYDRAKDEFQCSHGTVFRGDATNGQKMKYVYRSEGPAACGCGHEETKNGSVLRVRECHLTQREFRRILDEPENQALYRKRKCTVEPVFGQIKFGIGFRRFFYRGSPKVSSEWNVVCAAFNLKKIAALIGRGVIQRPTSTGFPQAMGMESGLPICIFNIYRRIVHCVHLFKRLVASRNFHDAPLAYCSRYVRV